MRFLVCMRTLGLDLLYAIRSLRQTPVVALVIVASLGLGIGANTAIFTFTDQLMLRLLPVKNPRELVQLDTVGGRIGTSYGRYSYSYPMYRDLRDKNQVFSGMLAYFGHTASLQAGEAAQMVRAELVSGNYFQVLGVEPAAGRLIGPADDVKPMGHPVAVLSYAAWRDRFGLDPKAIGSTVLVNKQPFTIIGVSRKGFDGFDVGSTPAVRVPISMKRAMTPTWDDLEDRQTHWLQVIARLKPGVKPETARASIEVLRRGIAQEEIKGDWWGRAPADAREVYVSQKMQLMPAGRGQSFLRRSYEKPLQVLMVLVVLVLMIACMNVANILLSRTVQRMREIAVRFSMGASRLQVARTLLVESLLLAFAGGVAGVLLSVWGGEYILRQINTLGLSTLTLTSAPDARVLLFAIAVTTITGVVFGLAPVWQASAVNLADTLKNQAGAHSAGGGHVRLRRMLIAGQIALSLLLLFGAGLFVRTLDNLQSEPAGVETTKVLAFAIDPTLGGYRPEDTIPFYRELYRRLESIPGVIAASGGGNRVLSGDDWQWTVRAEGYTPKKDERTNALFSPVGPGYFKALGARIISGREFLDSDNPKRLVAVVNEAFAKRFFGGANPVGRRLASDMAPNSPYDIEIVGLVSDFKYSSLREKSEAQFYIPYLAWPERTGRLNVLVRFRGEAKGMIESVRRTTAELDPSLPLYDVRTLSAELDRSLTNERLLTLLTSSFGILATVLAAIGLYGMLSFQVTRRTREIGIRVALGAPRGQIVAMVLREVGALLLFGGAIGIGAALLTSRLLESQLYGITAQDPVSFGAATAVLCLIALTAAAVPALRAAKTDPLLALRYE